MYIDMIVQYKISKIQNLNIKPSANSFLPNISKCNISKCNKASERVQFFDKKKQSVK